jgi:hypothetical protein
VYYVPRDLLQSPEWIASSSTLSEDIFLFDIDENTGHVLVHYLYTGAYQTLYNKEAGSVDEVKIEFKRAVLAYTAAERYSLQGLQDLAKNNIEHLGTEMDVFDIAKAVKDDFSRLLGANAWFHDYLKEKAKAMFEKDRTVFARDDIFGPINDVGLARVLAKCVLGLYNDMIERMLSAERVPTIGTSEECRPDVPHPPIDEGLVEASYTVETISEEDYACPAPECPVQDCPADDYLIEDYACPVQDCPADDCLIEDFPVKEVPVEEASIDDPVTAEEPEPVPEHAPEFEPVAEDELWYFGSSLKNKNKKARNGSIEIIEKVVEIEEEPTVAADPADEMGNPEFGKYNVEVTGESVAQAEDNITIWPLKPAAAVEELVSNGHSSIKMNSEQLAEAQAEICPLRVKHLLEGDKWKHCKQCRAIVRQVAIQLARASYTYENGYEMVDQVLIK